MKLITTIESCAFESEAGPLALSNDWAALKSRVNLWIVVKDDSKDQLSPVQHTGGQGGWRSFVFTNEAEAQATADMWTERYHGGILYRPCHLLDLKDDL